MSLELIKRLEDEVKALYNTKNLNNDENKWDTEKAISTLNECYDELNSAIKEDESSLNAAMLKVKREGFRVLLVEREFALRGASVTCSVTAAATKDLSNSAKNESQETAKTHSYYVDRAKKNDGYDTAFALLHDGCGHLFSLREINYLIATHYNAGLGLPDNENPQSIYPAGQGLCRLIGKEILNRLNADAIVLEDPNLEVILGSLQGQKVDMTKLDEFMTSHLEVFTGIYNALREGQSGVFKTSLASKSYLKEGMLPQDSIHDIVKYAQQKPNSRTAEAWRLTQLHYKNYDNENVDLINKMYNFSFEKSGIFKLSRVSGPWHFRHKKDVTLSEAQIKKGAEKEGSRTHKIVDALPPGPSLVK